MANKIYVDADKKLEVCDTSGLKTLEQINQEFGGDFTDVTDERTAAAEANKIQSDKDGIVEALITKKIRDTAVAALISENKIEEVDGKLAEKK